MAPETGQPEAAVPPGSTDPLLARLAEAGATIQALLSGTLDTIGPAQEAEFRAFFEGSLDAVIVLDDEGRYLAANEAALQLYRTSREELLGSRLERFADPGKDVGPRWRSFLERGRDRGETVLRRADGALRDVEYAAVANYQPGRHLIVARDITASRRDRAALRARLAQQAAV
ncbi:MAG: PAS domain S-box protein, partial [Gemmatimonadales bacterium]